MIKFFETIFIHPESANGIYLDYEDNINVNTSYIVIYKGIRKLTTEEYLNILELDKLNLHVPYILSLLNESDNPF